MSGQFPSDQGLACHCASLGQCRPRRKAEHGGGASAGGDYGAFEFEAVPTCDGFSHHLPVGVYAEHAQGRFPVSRHVRMQTDPAVPGKVITCDGVPGLGDRPADRAEGPVKPPICQCSIERYQPAADQRGQFPCGGGKCGCGKLRDPAA